MASKQVVTVLVIRDPDAGNEYVISAPDGVEVITVDADLGSSFDTRPNDADEALAAMDMVGSLMEETAHLPDTDPVRQAVLSLCDELREAAAEQAGEDEFMGTIPCPDCGSWFFTKYPEGEDDEDDDEIFHSLDCSGCGRDFERSFELVILGEQALTA